MLLFSQEQPFSYTAMIKDVSLHSGSTDQVHSFDKLRMLLFSQDQPFIYTYIINNVKVHPGSTIEVHSNDDECCSSLRIVIH